MSLVKRPLCRFGRFRVDPDRRLLFWGDEVVALRPRVFDTLLLLAERRGDLVSKEELLDAVWPDTVVEENNLSQNILALRRALETHPDDGVRIETVPRRGYRLIAPNEAVIPTVVPRPAPVPSLPEGSRPSAMEAVKHRLAAGLLAAAVVVLLAFALTWMWKRPRSVPPIPGVRAIAVLPLRSLPPASGEDFLGLGLADAVITRLGHVRSLSVRPTGALRSLQDGARNPVEAGRALQVDAVLDGQIQQKGNRTRVTMQLIGVPSGRTLWSEKFDVDTKDLFMLEDSISESVARALASSLSAAEAQRVSRDRPTRPEAYEAYLRGRFFWNRRNEASTWKARSLFEKAIALDANYALAYAGLADTVNALQFRVFDPGRARAMARKALSLDGSLAEAYAALGNTSLFADWNFSEAETHFRSALDLNPSYATAHQWYAYCFLVRGDLAGALKEIHRAQEADPLSPSIGVDVGNMLHYAGRYEDAMAEYRRVLELEPGFAQAHQMLLAELLRKGDLDAARQEAISLPFPGSSYAEACLAVLAARSGDRRQAEERLERIASPERWPAEASVALELGDKDRAVAALEDGYRRRDGAMLLIGADPRMDVLRSDPRFVDLLHRVGVVPVDRARL